MEKLKLVICIVALVVLAPLAFVLSPFLDRKDVGNDNSE